MTEKITLLSAFAYDDMRIEASGAISYMGVESDGQFEFDSFPARQRLGISVVCNINELGDATVFAKLRFNGEIKWAGEVELELEGTSTGVLVPVCHTFAVFDTPGELNLIISIDKDDGDSGQIVKSWKVLDASEASVD